MVKHTRAQYGFRPAINWEQAHEFLEREANAYMKYRLLNGLARLPAEHELIPAEDNRQHPDGGVALAISGKVLTLRLLDELVIRPQQPPGNQVTDAMI